MQKKDRKRLSLTKNLTGKKQKKKKKGRKGRGALIRAGAHIRDNTVNRVSKQVNILVYNFDIVSP